MKSTNTTNTKSDENERIVCPTSSAFCKAKVVFSERLWHTHKKAHENNIDIVYNTKTKRCKHVNVLID